MLSRTKQKSSRRLAAKKRVEVDHEKIIVSLIQSLGRGEVQLSCEEDAEVDFGPYFTRFVFKHYNLAGAH